jgi:hypothetical protein
LNTLPGQSGDRVGILVIQQPARVEDEASGSE